MAIKSKAKNIADLCSIDFILAESIMNYLHNYGKTVFDREKWYGR